MDPAAFLQVLVHAERSPVCREGPFHLSITALELDRAARAYLESEFLEVGEGQRPSSLHSEDLGADGGVLARHQESNSRFVLGPEQHPAALHPPELRSPHTRPDRPPPPPPPL